MDIGQERLIIGFIDYLKIIGDWILEIIWRYIVVCLSFKVLERNKGNDCQQNFDKIDCLVIINFGLDIWEVCGFFILYKKDEGIFLFFGG